MKQKKLGRGLDSLLSEAEKQAVVTPEIRPRRPVTPPKPPTRPIPKLPTTEHVRPPLEKQPRPEDSVSEGKAQNLVYLNTTELIPNRFQPRKEFAPESLDELTSSIKSTGILQPILVRSSPRGYEIVAGERRWRACKALKITQIPAIIKEKVDDREMLEWALIENTQRKDLNPIERARGYKELGETFGLSQEAIAERVGLDRSTVANFIRLLDLPSEVQADVSRETISMGHARALLSLEKKTDQIRLLQRIKKEGLSVRKLEHIVMRLKLAGAKPPKPSGKEDLYLKDLENRLRRRFGTKVVIRHHKKRGSITIEFYSHDDFQRILEILGQ